MAQLECCQSLDVPAVKSGIERARDDCDRVNLHFGVCTDVMTALESFL